ncbi:membrane lipoprotein lipid attachment site-containing protein [Corallococcus aberystwythensis]|uniref:Lipoprotein n=1 Tax=Corallococcus aberystwythensis TaxID=2316722 RepID=A0A3A8QY60_9BACT|nr:membrane lipoprotein lipid attachment site-containing protein [Corallococcus aberystwythensis]RKH69782.1 hypothetical protein D7W81_10320 [Corallococcus aberystwythensis]
MKRVVFAAVAALFLSACGGAPTDEAAANEELSSQEQGIIYPCDGSRTWTMWWYSDAAKTIEVGREDCDCGPYYVQHGVRGRYYDYKGTVAACF